MTYYRNLFRIIGSVTCFAWCLSTAKQGPVDFIFIRSAKNLNATVTELGGAAVAVTAIGHGALRRPRRIGEGQRGLRGRRTTGLRLRNGQGWQGLLFARCDFFDLCTFLCLCMPCGELQFCVVILTNKCFFLNDVFVFLIDVHLCIWGMRRRATWDGHRLNAPACIGPQARAMSVGVSPCFSILILHDRSNIIIYYCVACIAVWTGELASSCNQATAHGMCLPRGNLWTGVHQQGHQALTQQLLLHCWQELHRNPELCAMTGLEMRVLSSLVRYRLIRFIIPKILSLWKI